MKNNRGGHREDAENRRENKYISASLRNSAGFPPRTLR